MDHKKGGLDFVFYAFEVYEKQLFPYCEQVRGLDQAKEIFIGEDKVGVYHKARKILAPLMPLVFCPSDVRFRSSGSVTRVEICDTMLSSFYYE